MSLMALQELYRKSLLVFLRVLAAKFLYCIELLYVVHASGSCMSVVRWLLLHLCGFVCIFLIKLKEKLYAGKSYFILATDTC